MRKFNSLLFVLIGLIIVSCENVSGDDDQIAENNEIEIFELSNTRNSDDLLQNLMQSEYINSLNLDKFYQVSDSRLNQNYDIVSIENNRNSRNGYIVKSAIVNYSLNHLGIQDSITFIVKLSTSNTSGGNIFEILSPNNGNVIYFLLDGVSDEDYNTFRNNSQLRDTVYCFENFETCVDHMNGGENPGDDVICEWLPCTTFAYVGCFIFEQEGLIQDSDCFRGCQACDVFIDAN